MKNPVRVFVALWVLLLCGAAPVPVKIVYAGSLVTPMERSIGPAFSRDCGCQYEGESKGSVALAKMIQEGVRSPDIFISADSQIMNGLLHPQGRPPWISEYTIFGTTHLVIGYSAKSRFAAEFEQAASGKLAVPDLLRTPGMRIGRTDPRLDPKGVRTVHALQAMGLPEAWGEIFPEEDLLVRLEAGDLDAAFLYSTESATRRIATVALPDVATRERVEYSIAVLSAASNPQGARRFRDFVLTGRGRAMLEWAGVIYGKPAVIRL